MISSLKGRVNRVWGNNIEIDVNGIGYLVFVGNGYLKKHNQGDEVVVRTYMQVSENDMALYGFETGEELDLFKMLISVSGVGPKTAAGITGEKEAVEITKAIGEADVEFFGKIKGIGKKTAQRIIVDLKSKVNSQNLDMAALAGVSGELKEDDLYLSLKQLGFDKKEIEKVMGRVPSDIGNIEDRLGWCLKNME